MTWPGKLSLSLRAACADDESRALSCVAKVEAAERKRDAARIDEAYYEMRNRSTTFDACLGTSVTSTGRRFRVTMPHDEMRAGGHWLITGATGTGKTYLVTALLLQMIQHSGRKLVVIDMKGELASLLRDVVVPSYIASWPYDQFRSLARQFAVIAPFDPGATPPFQVLARDRSLPITVQAHEVASSFGRTIGRDLGVLQTNVLKQVLLLAIDQGLTLADLPALLQDEGLRRGALLRCRLPEVRAYFAERFPRERNASVASLLVSRAEWLWRTTTVEQRRACFSSGLGRAAGVFLYDHLSELIELLVEFQAAVESGDAPRVAAAACAFAQRVVSERALSIGKVPDKWSATLGAWVSGIPFRDVLRLGKSAAIQDFIQNGVVFRLVWAAEAVRVQAQTLEHEWAGELGEGPARALTYGVPSVAAALLCQRGFSSRSGATWATARLSASFSDYDGMAQWIADNRETLSDPTFWETADQHLLWTRQRSGGGAGKVDPWTREVHQVAVSWVGSAPPSGTRARLLPNAEGGGVQVCAQDLLPLGYARVLFNPRVGFMTGTVGPAGKLTLERFGPE